MKTRRIKATLRVHDVAVAGASTGISISLRARLMGASAIAGGALRGLAIAAGMVTAFGGAPALAVCFSGNAGTLLSGCPCRKLTL
jgi:hypothetical protein